MSLTIKEFRDDPVKVAAWANVLNMPITQEVLRVLRDNGPEFEKLPAGLSPVDANIKLGHEHGFAEHHQRLEEMAERWPISKGQLPTTYEPPEEEIG